MTVFIVLCHYDDSGTCNIEAVCATKDQAKKELLDLYHELEDTDGAKWIPFEESFNCSNGVWYDIEEHSVVDASPVVGEITK